MSRSWIFGGVALLAAIGLVNIVLLLRHPAAHEVKVSPPPAATALPAVVAQNASQTPTSSAAPLLAASPLSSAAPVEFVAEREALSASGRLKVVYTRNPKQKLHRISVTTSASPAKTFVLWEGKGTAWALVSPDDQWIAIDQHTGASGRVQLYHQSGGDPAEFEPVESSDALADRVWQSFLVATQADPQTPRTGVTVDATDWNPDSRGLGLTLAFLRASGETDVAEPWTCNYDITSKQISPGTRTETFARESATNSNETQQVAMTEANSLQPDATDTQEEELPGEKFPATRMVPLTVPDVNDSSLSEINYAINEMFARHGATFKDKKVGREFSQFTWYQPQPGLTYDDIENQFSDLEKENLKVLGRCRDAKVAAAKRNHASRPIRGKQVPEPSAGEQIMRGILQNVIDSLQNQ